MPAIEQSFGMTTGTGDGTVGGYSSARVTSMFANTFSRTNGVFTDTAAVGTITGLSTSTLAVGAYTCINQGFYYEGSGVTLTMVGVGAGVYYLVNRVNNTGSAVAVTRSEGTGATTTTIAPRTVRTALITTATYSNTTDIILATITVNASAVITVIDETSREWASNPTLSTTEYATTTNSSGSGYASGNELVAVANGTITNSLMGTITVTTGGTYRVAKSGLYLFTANLAWDTNVTGSRIMRFSGSPIGTGGTAASLLDPGSTGGLIPANTVVQGYSWQGALVANTNYTLRLYQNSGTARNWTYLATSLSLVSV